MTPTRVRTLVIIAAVCAIVAWLLLRQAYSSLPPLPWTGVPALLLLAVAEAWTGRSLRSRLRGRGKPIPPIAVARMAALAKATSLAAAFVGGFAAGFLLYVASSLDKAAYRADAYVSAGTFGAAVSPRPGRPLPGVRLPCPHPAGRARPAAGRLSRLAPVHLSMSPTTKNIEPRMAGRSATRLDASSSESTWILPNEAERSFSRQGVLPPRETR